MYRKLQQILKPKEFSSLSHFQVPATPLHIDEALRHTDPEQIVWDTIITREEIEAHILIFNQALRLRRIIQDALRYT